MDLAHREIRIFISSPSDVKAERRIVNNQITEFNDTWSEYLSLSFRPVMWEKNTHPGISEYPQSVINRQIKGKYDAFLGIMWKSFGTPTPNAGSGTEEEFNEALAALTANKKRILFYFSLRPISPNSDSNQIKLVNEFKKRISSENGVLYREYRNMSDFQAQIRIALASIAQEEVPMNFKIAHENAYNDKNLSLLQDFTDLGDNIESVAGNLFLRGSTSLKLAVDSLKKVSVSLNKHRKTLDLATIETNQIKTSNKTSALKKLNRISRPVMLSSFEFTAKVLIAEKKLREYTINGFQDIVDAYLLISPYLDFQEYEKIGIRVGVSPLEAAHYIKSSLEFALNSFKVFKMSQDDLKSTALDIGQHDLAESLSCVSETASEMIESIELALPICQELVNIIEKYEKKSKLINSSL